VSETKPGPVQQNPGALIAVMIVLALQAGIAKVSGRSWSESVIPFAVACCILVPFFLYVLPRRALAKAVIIWGIGIMFIALPFAMASSTVSVALVVPPLASAFATWASPAQVRIIVFLVSYAVGFFSGVVVVWAAWRAFPPDQRAA
jgi:hypothetical protein